MSSKEKALLLWSLTAKNAGGNIIFLLAPGLCSGAMLRIERIYFFWVLQQFQFLWGDFYTSWASQGWRRHHLCITRGDQEDCNLSSVKWESWARELSLKVWGGVGLVCFHFPTNKHLSSSKKPPKMNESMRWEGFKIFFWMFETFGTFAFEVGLLWNCGRLGFAEVWTCWWSKQCIWQEVSYHFSKHPKIFLPVFHVILQKNS